MRLAPDGRTFLDDLYQLRDLFSFGLSLELGNANWQLQIARWLGPLVAAAALLEGFAALSRRRADAFRARRTRGHTVVLGLGDRGIRIATALAAAGRDVAAVEIDPTETGVGILRHRDGRVVEGDARLHHQLEAGRAYRPRRRWSWCAAATPPTPRWWRRSPASNAPRTPGR